MGGVQAKLSMDEQMKIHKKQINGAIRELEREKNKLATNERKLIADIKANAKKNQMNAVKIMAKDLVRCRKYQSKFLEMKTHLQGVNLQLQTMKSTQAMASSMATVGKIMHSMNQKIDAPSMQKIMKEFQRENEKMQMTEEMMGDAVDGIMEDDEEEQENVVNMVLDEIGIEMGDKMNATAHGNIQAGPQAEAAAQPAGGAEEDLESRLAALKR